MRLGVSSFAYRYAAAGLMAREGALAAALHILERASAAGAEVVQFCDNVPWTLSPPRTSSAWPRRPTAPTSPSRWAPAGLPGPAPLPGWRARSAPRPAPGARHGGRRRDPGRPEAAAPLVRESGVLLAVENHFDASRSPADHRGRRRAGGGHLPGHGKPTPSPSDPSRRRRPRAAGDPGAHQGLPRGKGPDRLPRHRATRSARAG